MIFSVPFNIADITGLRLKLLTEIIISSFRPECNLRYSGNGFMLGVNWIHFQFNRPFQKKEEPYNLYSLRGTS